VTHDTSDAGPYSCNALLPAGLEPIAWVRGAHARRSALVDSDGEDRRTGPERTTRRYREVRDVCRQAAVRSSADGHARRCIKTVTELGDDRDIAVMTSRPAARSGPLINEISGVDAERVLHGDRRGVLRHHGTGEKCGQQDRHDAERDDSASDQREAGHGRRRIASSDMRLQPPARRPSTSAPSQIPARKKTVRQVNTFSMKRDRFGVPEASIR
jgi:hypothetical protein